jgi:hypothetical protein
MQMVRNSIVKRPAHRPSLLTEARLARICFFVMCGATVASATAALGIHRTTVQNWIRRGSTESNRIERQALKLDVDPEEIPRRPSEEPYFEAYRRIEQAKGQFEVRAVMAINKAVEDGHWRAAAWLLERRRPKTFGPVRYRLGPKRKQTAETAETPYVATPEMLKRADAILAKFGVYVGMDRPRSARRLPVQSNDQD